MSKKKVLLGMSGGVDSSVAALLLLKAGYDVTGMTMRLRPDAYMQQSASGGCCSLDDIDDARRVCYNILPGSTRRAARRIPALHATGT